MRTLLHLSDLHFGRIDEQLLQPLRETAARIAPDLVVVSGDLTQRARAGQFRAARAFLGSLPRPQIVVPGNHDVPLYNVVARFLYPLAGYRRFISHNPESIYEDEEIVVVGLNSARSFAFKNGRLSPAQIDRFTQIFERASPGAVRVLVSHHPFELPAGCEGNRVVRGAGRVLAAMAKCGGDVILSGHFHRTHASCTALREQGTTRAIILSQTGTATSTRLFGEEPSFNVLRTDRNVIELEAYAWNRAEKVYARGAKTVFTRTGAGWREDTRA